MNCQPITTLKKCSSITLPTGASVFEENNVVLAFRLKEGRRYQKI
jgi:hypothetical protein